MRDLIDYIFLFTASALCVGLLVMIANSGGAI